MSTFWRYVRIQSFVLLCGIVGPIFLTIYFVSGGDPMMKWMFWVGLLITAIDVLIAPGAHRGRDEVGGAEREARTGRGAGPGPGHRHSRDQHPHQ